MINTHMLDWQNIPVFICGTLRDMQFERDHLRLAVFPKIEQDLQNKGFAVHLIPIDLRWGADIESEVEEAIREREILSVCFEEVERCKPFFIAMLGDRYGWIPSKDHFDATTFGLEFGQAAIGKSVSELEMILGALMPALESAYPLVYLRKIDYTHMDIETACYYSDELAGRQENATKLKSLKSRALELLDPKCLREYTVKWDALNKKIGHSDIVIWGDQVSKDLFRVLHTHLLKYNTNEKNGQSSQKFSADRWSLSQFIEDIGKDFVGQKDLIEHIRSFVCSRKHETWAICLQGDTGVGKSAIFSKIYRVLSEMSVYVLANASDSGTLARSTEHMIARFVDELTEELGIEPLVSLDAPVEQLIETFGYLLKELSKQRCIVVLIDGLSEMSLIGRYGELPWLPQPWPDGAYLISTDTTDGWVSQTLRRLSGVSIKEIRLLEKEEARELVLSKCRRYHRKIPEPVLSMISELKPESSRYPLWLSIAIGELNSLSVRDFTKYNDIQGVRTPLTQLMNELIQKMPEKPDELCLFVLDRAESDFSENEVRSLLLPIALGRNGWRQQDLSRLVPLFEGGTFEDGKFSILRSRLNAHITQRGTYGQWVLHSHMRCAVQSKYLKTEYDVTKGHTLITQHLNGLPINDPLRMSEFMSHLIWCGDEEAAKSYYQSGERTDEELSAATTAMIDHASGLDWELGAHGPQANTKQGPFTGYPWVRDLLSALDTKRSNMVEESYHAMRMGAIDASDSMSTKAYLLRNSAETAAELLKGNPIDEKKAFQLWKSFYDFGQFWLKCTTSLLNAQLTNADLDELEDALMDIGINDDPTVSTLAYAAFVALRPGLDLACKWAVQQPLDIRWRRAKVMSLCAIGTSYGLRDSNSEAKQCFQQAEVVLSTWRYSSDEELAEIKAFYRIVASGISLSAV